MENLDISIDEAKAKIWMQDVNTELAAVRALLEKVNAATVEVAGSDDTIMNGIYNVGVAMGNAWTKMCSVFDQAQDNIVKSAERIGTAVQELVDYLNKLRNMF